MVKMLTLFGKDLKKMSYNELKRELKCQKRLMSQIRKARGEELHLGGEKMSQIRQDKVAFYDIYLNHLQAFVDDIEFYMDRRIEPVSNRSPGRPQYLIREENKKRRQKQLNDNYLAWQDEKNEGFGVMWDRDRFLLIAEDRGYQTEESVTFAVAEMLNFTAERAKQLLKSGRFTWGQVLVLGSEFEMTPKEFCDTFLAGYFINDHGEYRADYEHIRKDLLLRRAMKAERKARADRTPFEEIYVDVDGRPLGEEDVWFDD